MKKRGLSGVITIVLFMIIAIILISILSIFVLKQLKSSSEISALKAELAAEEMTIKDVKGDLDFPSTINLTIKKGAGQIIVKNQIVYTPKKIDAFSVTDLSGSMADQCINQNLTCCSKTVCNTTAKCESCNGTWETKITSAKRANNAFIDGILNYSGNRVGLVGYEQAVYWWMPHNLSTNSTSLKNKVNSWVANGATCICCGINFVINTMGSQLTPDRGKAMVIMSDGQANVNCTASGNASLDAINAACRAYEYYGIKVYSVGFGSVAAGNRLDERTLKQIAACGNGTYYYSDVESIVRIYKAIASQIAAEYTAVQSFGYLKVFFYNGSLSHTENIPFNQLPMPIETKEITVPIGKDLNKYITNIQRIEIYPVAYTKAGKEVFGPMLDFWERK